MAQPYVGEIRQAGFNFAPVGWFLCQGQLLPIAEYEVLFTLIGTTYGGDGVQTFGLPNLSGRVPIHQGKSTGSTYVMGQMAGNEQVTITSNQMAAHTHIVQANSGFGTINAPTTKSTWAQVSADGANANPAYSAAPGNTTLSPTAVGTAGGSIPIEVMQPYLVINFMIAWAGIFPSQS
jgi:microcystin-dependent protein